MALTGIQIFKLLPKTNCGECGVPTCLAFAMNLAAAKAELASCPYISAESKALLSEASAPPIRPVSIGSGDNVVKIGGETVLFRHEKTFVNKPGLALMISDAMPADEVAGRIKRFNLLKYEWIGLVLRAEMIAAKNESGDAGQFAALVKKVMDETDAALILMSDSADALKAALQVSAQRTPLIYAATDGNMEAMVALAKEYKCPLAAKAANLESLALLTDKISAAGVKDIVLDGGARTVRGAFEEQVFVRRAASGPEESFAGLFDDRLPLRNDERPDEGGVDRRRAYCQVCRDHRPVRLPGGKPLPALGCETQHLHRPATADDDAAGNLSDRKSERGFTGARYDQFCADLLHRLR